MENAMSTENYAESISRMLASEGGYVNHPSDPGGPTNFGITIADYRKYVKPDASADDVRAMKVDEAKSIYREKYWGAMRCDELPAGVDYCVFDYAVNSGTGRVPKVLQRILAIAVTGRMDEAAVAAARAHDARILVQAICDERLRFLQGLKTWPVFGKGWGKRVGEVRVAALALTDKGAGRIPIRTDAPATPTPGKGVVPVNDGARRGAAGGAIATGGVVAQQSAANGADWIVVAVILVVALAVAGGAWAFWHWRRKRLQDAPA
jgi:lysozyme family protein